MKKNFLKISALSLALGCALLSGCSNTVNEQSENMQYALPMGEADYRAAIALLGEDEVSNAMKVKYYEALHDLDVFEDNDYRALIDAYERAGDSSAARAMIIEAHKLNPSAEYVEKLNSLTVTISDSDEAAGVLADVYSKLVSLEGVDLSKSAASANIAGGQLLALINTDDFRASMSDGLVGVNRVSVYKNADYTCEITCGYAGTDICFTSSDRVVKRVSLGKDQMVVAYAIKENDAYNGAYTALHFSLEGRLGTVYTGTMKSNLLTTSITVKTFDTDKNSDTFGGITGNYTGKLKVTGESNVTGYDVMEEKGIIVYAVDDENDSYLYVNAPKEGKFIFDNEFVGILK